MPRPMEGESKQDFIARAIAEFRREGYPQDEAAGRAYGYWRQYHKKAKRKVHKDYSTHKDKYKHKEASRG